MKTSGSVFTRHTPAHPENIRHDVIAGFRLPFGIFGQGELWHWRLEIDASRVAAHFFGAMHSARARTTMFICPSILPIFIKQVRPRRFRSLQSIRSMLHSFTQVSHGTTF